jgi:hypothetical protein
VRAVLALDVAGNRAGDREPGLLEGVVTAAEVAVTIAAVFALAVIYLLALLIARFIRAALACSQ